MIRDWLCLFVPEAERALEFQRLAACPEFGAPQRIGDWFLVGEPGAAAHDAGLPPPNLVYSYGQVAHQHQLKRNPSRILHLAEENPEHLDQLPGDFSFAALQADGRATLVASVCGQGRWHFRVSASRVVFTTRQDWLALVQDEPAALAPLGGILALLACSGLPGHTATLAGATTLRGGEYATVGPGRSQVGRYFRPLPLSLEAPTPAALSATSTRLHQQLRRTLEAELSTHPEAQTLVLHSGGLDSSLLVGLAQHHLGGIRLGAVSLVPPQHDPTLARERTHQDYLRDAFETTLELQADEPTLRSWVTARRLLPCTAFAHLALDAQAQAQGAFNSALSGYFADETFGVWRRREWLRSVPLVALPRLWFHQVTEYPVAQVKWHERRHRPWGPPLPRALPEVFHRDLRAEYEALRNSAALRDTERPAEHLLQLHQLTNAAGSFAEVVKSAGMSAVLPFTSREMLELACETHPALLFRRGLSKMPLRKVGEGILPGAALERRDKGNWSDSAELRVPPPAFPAATARLLDSAWLSRQATLPLGLVLQLQTLEQLHQAAESLNYAQQSYRNR